MDILVVDDHTAMREEMVSLIEEQDDLDVVGQASGGEDAVHKAKALRPTLVVMDVAMSGMNGIEATRIICKSQPGIHVLALSNHTGENLVAAMLEAGAKGYLTKERAYEELIPAIRTVGRGERYVSAQGKG